MPFSLLRRKRENLTIDRRRKAITATLQSPIERQKTSQSYPNKRQRTARNDLERVNCRSQEFTNDYNAFSVQALSTTDLSSMYSLP